MGVFVDNARIPYRRMLMSHMIADDVGELFDMADRIGLAGRHFQNGSFPHFDVSAGYREHALRMGAEAVDKYGLVSVMKRYRVRLASDPEEMARLRDLVERYSR